MSLHVCQTTPRCHIPEDSYLRGHCRKKLRLHPSISVFHPVVGPSFTPVHSESLNCSIIINLYISTCRCELILWTEC